MMSLTRDIYKVIKHLHLNFCYLEPSAVVKKASDDADKELSSIRSTEFAALVKRLNIYHLNLVKKLYLY